MPFMIGKEPIRRTLRYLEAGKLYFKNRIQVVTFNYNTHGVPHKGTRDFVFWHLPQVQYKNPNVQLVTLRNMTPTPFIKCYYEDGNTMLIDVDSKNKDEILTHLIKVVGKTQEDLLTEAVVEGKKANPANFGLGCSRGCMCVIPGQVPCSGTVPLPYHMRGKYKYKKVEQE